MKLWSSWPNQRRESHNFTNNIFTIESRIKEDHDNFLKYKSDTTEARKTKKSLERQIQSQEKITYSLNEKLETKEDELRSNIDEKEKLEKKVTDLLDVLYGCPECGLNSCKCRELAEEDYSGRGGDNSVKTSEIELNMIFPPTLTPESLSEPLPPPPSCESIPWTPPLTPPCINCGGLNYGPSPSSVCFPCLPTILSTSEPCN